ncbi:MAG: ferredoxin, partial [Desulfovibrio sp.]|nr:ferredoxin [Desulfovibrio sp.]
MDQGYRLACQTSLPEGGTVWLPRQSRRGGQVILTQGLAAAPRLNPTVTALDLTVPLPTLDEPMAHRERLAEQLEPHLTGCAVEFPLAVLRRLPAALQAQEGRVTTALWQGRRVLDVAAGHGQPCLGLAVDLGTTTVVAYLMDLATGRNLAVASAVNPQIA